MLLLLFLIHAMWPGRVFRLACCDVVCTAVRMLLVFSVPLSGNNHTLGWESSIKMVLNYCWSSVIDPVCRGYILNEMTGRTIKLNSATYNKLVANGHVVDRKNGVLTPPGKAGDESDDTDIDQQPSYTPSRSARSRLSSGHARRD